MCCAVPCQTLNNVTEYDKWNLFIIIMLCAGCVWQLAVVVVAPAAVVAPVSTLRFRMKIQRYRSMANTAFRLRVRLLTLFICIHIHLVT